MNSLAMTKVKCDECGAVYYLNDNVKVIKKESDIEETVIKCPVCSEETVAVRTNTEIRYLQEQVSKERIRANKKIRKGVSLNKAERKLRQVKRTLKEKMDKFNGRG